MRILFIGGTKRGYLTLKALVESGASVNGVISLRQDEHEIERCENMIESFSGEFNISCYETKLFKDKDYAQIISREIQPDIAYVVGSRVMISKEIYELPPLGTLCVHDSYLPEYRGFAPLNWSIINGEDHTGVTLFYLNELMDGGDIVAQTRVPIGPHDTAPLVYERICKATVDIVLETHGQLVEGTAPRARQDYSTGSFTCSRRPTDGMVDWGKSTLDIYNQIRALTYPYPGAFTYFKGERLTICKAKPVERPLRYVGRIPGRIVGISKAEGWVDALTGDGVLRVFEVQVEGGETTAAANVIKSVRDTLGLSVVDLHDRLRALEAEVTRLVEDCRQ